MVSAVPFGGAAVPDGGAATRGTISRVVSLLLVLAGLAFGSTAALAHAALIGSEPADGAVLRDQPAQLVLTFSEPVSPLTTRLLGADGQITALNEVSAQQSALVVALPEHLAVGTHVLSWRVASQDGHPIGGSVTFSVGRADPPRQSLGVADSDARLPLWLSRWFELAALGALIGGAVFYGFIAPARGGRWLALLSPLALAALTARLVVEAFGAAGGDLHRLADPGFWRGPVLVGMAMAFAGEVLALLLATLSFRGGAGAAKWLSALALVVVAAVFSVSGHAATASPRLVMQPAIFLHIAGVVFWAGSLLPLLALTRHGAADTATALANYSRPVLAAVLALVAGGLVAAVIQLGAVQELWRSGYGVVLSVKLAMLLPLLFLASINRLLLTPRVRRGDAAALRWLRRSLGGEIALVLAIFAVVALWQFTPPPRQMAAASAQSPAGLRLQAHGPRGMAHLVVTPARPGPVQVAISVMDVQSRPWEVQAVELVLVDPQGRIEPIRRDAHRLTATTWQVDQLAIPAPGRWELQLDLLVSDFDKVSLHTSVELAAP